MVMQLEEFTNRKVDSKVVDIMYVDIMYIDMQTEGKMTFPVPMTKRVELVEYVAGTSLKRLAAEMLDREVRPNDVISSLELDPSDIPPGYSDEERMEVVRRKVRMRMNAASHYIATKGRIGLANTVVANSFTSDAYALGSHPEIKLVVNNEVPVDTLFVLRNNDIDQPGFKFFHNEDARGDFYAICGVGFFPANQACRIDITIKNKSK